MAATTIALIAALHASIDSLGESIDDETVNSNEINEPQILIFNDGEEPFLEERLIQDRTPAVNDHISFYDENTGEWVNAMVIQNLSKRWKHYFNIQYDDGSRDGLYLIPDTRWTFQRSINNIPPDAEEMPCATSASGR